MSLENLTTEDLLTEILKRMDVTSYVRPEEVPNIDLYMDQVTTFMESSLSGSKRHPEDKVLTKTMINNYAKNHLLPAPEKKKYTAEHLQVLVIIYYLKNILSIGDIQALLTPILNAHFKGETGNDISAIYSQMVDLCKSEMDLQSQDAQNKFKAAMKTFPDKEGSDGDTLRLFAFICLLSYDVFEKKQLIEYLIDHYFTEDSEKAKDKNKNKTQEK